MEYYGWANQVNNEVYVSSETRFQDFEFDGCTYHFVQARLSEGIDTPPCSGGVRITDQERTLADCLKDMDKILGPMEIITVLECMHCINEKKLLQYLSLYDNQFLYQKAGFLLWQFRETLGLSGDFFSTCQDHLGKSKRYLTRDTISGIYNDKWKLVISSEFFHLKTE